MVFKINISEKTGKTFKLEAEAEELIGKSIHDKINGIEVSPDLNGYEFEIAGASDIAGLPSLDIVEGVGLKRVLLTFGKGMKKRSRREGKRVRTDYKPRGLRLRRTIRGKVISPSITQINLRILKEGNKKLAEIFPEQNLPKQKAEVKPVEIPAQ
ncbi:MAG: S6e family ribosomal protein [Candidatus Nanoarchaeia archaeon]|nr:S6e family ribosomal protein [Candidatus Nanoarchaeia archaeon]